MTKVNIPTSPEELTASLTDKATLKNLWDDPKVLGEFIQGYADQFEKLNPDSVQELKEGLQASLAEWLQANRAVEVPPALLSKAAAEQVAGRRTSAQRALWNKRAPGVKAEGIFDDAAELLQAGWHAADRYLGASDRRSLNSKLGKLTEIQNSFGSEVPADGGFLIPETLRSELLQVALETAVVRSRATVIPMSSLRVPIPYIDSTSNVTNIFGGVQCYWTEESAALTESSASFGRVVLDAKKLTALANVPNELLQDAPAFQGFFDAKFPQAIAWFEDVAFMTGAGATEPLGFINCDASVAVTAESGQATKTIVWENIVKMYSRMLPTSHGNACWIASHDTFPELATMALSVGTGGGPVWMGNYTNPGAATPPMTILGRPVIFTEKAKTLGTTGDINYVDLSYYLIGDRMSMQAMSSPHYKFANDQTSYRIIQRVDGRPWISSAITPQNNSTSTLTPFVRIAAR